MARVIQSEIQSSYVPCPYFPFFDKLNIDSLFCLQSCFFLWAAYFAQILSRKFCLASHKRKSAADQSALRSRIALRNVEIDDHIARVVYAPDEHPETV